MTALRDSTEEVFLSTGSQLMEVSTLLDSARTAVHALDHLAQIDLIDRCRSEAVSQSTALQKLTAEFDGCRSSIRAATAALYTLDNGISDVRRSIVTMRIVVLNARVNLASLSAEDQSLSSFAEGGQAVVAESADLLARLETAMAVIRSAVDQIEAMVEQISVTLSSRVIAAFRIVMTDVAGFERGVHDVRSRGVELSRKLQAMLDASSRAVMGLQVGDSTRQRLNHIILTLSLPEAQHIALQALAAELLQDTAQTHAAMLGQLQNSVADMTTGLSDLLQSHLKGFFRADGQVTDAETLLEGGNRLRYAIEALHPLQARTRLLSDTMAQEFESFRGLICEGENVQESARMIGINAVLSCRRLREGSAALKVVAEQLQVVSSEVGGRFAVIRTILDMVSTLGAEITSGTDQLVSQSVELPERLSSSISPMIETVAVHLEPAQHAIERLQDRLSDLDFDFRPAVRHSRMIDALASEIGSPVLPRRFEPLPQAVLARIHAAFTIEREREIFRTVFKDFAVPAGPNTSNGPDQMDNGFLL